MTAIRLVIQGNYASSEERIEERLALSRQIRQLPGCRQAEDFRSTEFPGNLMHLQLWENAAAFDRFWRESEARKVLEEAQVWQAPNHYGTTSAPRRHGQSGVELYRHAYFGRVDSAWLLSDEAERSEAVRFPAWGPVRILIQGTSPAGGDNTGQLDNAQETRLEHGCIHFENYRGIEYEENTCLIELWSTPAIYDIHWLNRLVQQAARSGPTPARPQVERRYGQAGAEWYAHSYFTLVDGIWHPENEALRMVTVRW